MIPRPKSLAVVVAVALLPSVVGAAPPPARCLPTPPGVDIGTVELFHVPAQKATELNTEAKILYREGKWEEARARYRAALAVDPDFLAPRLNVACSFVRQERFDEATAEARALLERAYVPWAREALEAADMGALKTHPQMGQLRAAMAAAARRWGEGLADGLVFVARQRPPLRVPPTGEGVFISNPHQEVYAFVPGTNLFRQLTADDGRVIALARSADRRRIAYVTAEKIVRAAQGEVALRGVAVGELVLGTMAALPTIRIEGDVKALEIAEQPSGFAYLVTREGIAGAGGPFRRGAGDVLVPLSPIERRRGWRSLTRLDARGAIRVSPPESRYGCATASERVGPEGVRTITVRAPGRPERRIGEILGAGLAGLPLP